MKALQFRMAGVPVRVEPIFFLVMGLLGLVSGYTGVLIPVFMVVAGVSVLVHEMGHATAHVSFGARPTVTLTGFGGVTMGPVHSRARSLVVTLAGPGAGFLAAAVAGVLVRVVPTDSVLIATALRDLVWVNVVWGVFNLLPILPLDGGHVASDLFGPRRAQVISVAGALCIGAFGLYTGRVFLTFIAFMFGSQAFQALRAEKGRPQLAQLEEARRALLAGEPDRAAEEADAVAAAPASWPVEVTASELAAWAHLAGGRPEAAHASLARLRAGASATTPLVRRMTGLAQGAGEEPIAPALVRCDDVVAATVTARLVAAAGLIDRVLEELAGMAGGPDGRGEAAAGEPPDAGAGDGGAEGADETSIPGRGPGGDAGPSGAHSARGPAAAPGGPFGPDAEFPLSNGYRALQLGLHHAGRFQDAARVGDALYRLEPDSLVAYNVACSWALAGESEPALAWLDRAVDRGFRDTALLDRDSNFDAIRNTDGFRALRSWIESGPPEGGAGAERPATGT